MPQIKANKLKFKERNKLKDVTNNYLKTELNCAAKHTITTETATKIECKKTVLEFCKYGSLRTSPPFSY